MSAVVKLLETLACHPTPSTSPEFEAALAGLDAPTRDALRAGDPLALATALGVMPALACMVFTPDNDEPQEPMREDDPESPDEQEPRPE